MRHTHTKSLTDPALLYLLGCNPKNGENFDHYLTNRICSFRGWRHLRVGLQSPNKKYHAPKDVKECLVGFPNPLCCLRDAQIV